MWKWGQYLQQDNRAKHWKKVLEVVFGKSGVHSSRKSSNVTELTGMYTVDTVLTESYWLCRLHSVQQLMKGAENELIRSCWEIDFFLNLLFRFSCVVYVENHLFLWFGSWLDGVILVAHGCVWLQLN